MTATELPNNSSVPPPSPALFSLPAAQDEAAWNEAAKEAAQAKLPEEKYKQLRALKSKINNGLIIPYYPEDLEWKKRVDAFLNVAGDRLHPEDLQSLQYIDDSLCALMQKGVPYEYGKPAVHSKLVAPQLCAELGEYYRGAAFSSSRAAVENVLLTLSLEDHKEGKTTQAREQAKKAASDFLATLELVQIQADIYLKHRKPRVHWNHDQELYCPMAETPMLQSAWQYSGHNGSLIITSRGTREFVASSDAQAEMKMTTTQRYAYRTTLMRGSQVKQEAFKQLSNDRAMVESIRQQARAQSDGLAALNAQILGAKTGEAVSLQFPEGEKEFYMPADFLVSEGINKHEAFGMFVEKALRLSAEREALKTQLAPYIKPLETARQQRAQLLRDIKDRAPALINATIKYVETCPAKEALDLSHVSALREWVDTLPEGADDELKYALDEFRNKLAQRLDEFAGKQEKIIDTVTGKTNGAGDKAVAQHDKVEAVYAALTGHERRVDPTPEEVLKSTAPDTPAHDFMRSYAEKENVRKNVILPRLKAANKTDEEKPVPAGNAR